MLTELSEFGHHTLAPHTLRGPEVQYRLGCGNILCRRSRGPQGRIAHGDRGAFFPLEYITRMARIARYSPEEALTKGQAVIPAAFWMGQGEA
jgi:hypothetical protein